MKKISLSFELPKVHDSILWSRERRVLIRAEPLSGKSYLLRCIAILYFIKYANDVIFMSDKESLRENMEGPGGFSDLMRNLPVSLSKNVYGFSGNLGHIRVMNSDDTCLREAAAWGPDVLVVDDSENIQHESLRQLTDFVIDSDGRYFVCNDSNIRFEEMQKSLRNSASKELKRSDLPQNLLRMIFDTSSDEKRTALQLAIDCGLEIDPWLKIALNNLEKGYLRQALLCGRQVGKTTAAAVMVVRLLIKYPGSLIVVAAVAHRQSKNLVGMARHALEKIGLKSMIRSGSSSRSPETLWLTNGSQAVAVPANGPAIRGFPGPIAVFLDEASYTEDEIVYQVLFPMLAIGGMLIALSSAGMESGWFYKAIQSARQNKAIGIHESDLKNMDWRIVEAKSSDCPRISQEFLDTMADEMPRDEVDAEFYNKFRQMEDKPFSIEVVKKIIYSNRSKEEPPTLPPEGRPTHWKAGLDWASIRDRCVFICADELENDKDIFYDIVEISELEEKGYPAKARNVALKLLKYAERAPVSIYCDATGPGQGPTDFLKEFVEDGFTLNGTKILGTNENKKLNPINIWFVVVTGQKYRHVSEEDEKQKDETVWQDEKRITAGKEWIIFRLTSFTERYRIGAEDGIESRRLVRELDEYRLSQDRREVRTQDGIQKTYHFDRATALSLVVFGPPAIDMNIGVIPIL